jgi:hypothetical protein
VEFKVSSGFGLTDDTQVSMIPDLYESAGGNNTSETAFRIVPFTPLSSRNVLTESLSIHSASDEDWFEFQIGGGTAHADILIGFGDSDGDIDARLYRKEANGTLTTVRSSTSSDDDELLSLDVNAGTYLLKVYGYNDAINFYSLTIDVDVVPPAQVVVGADAGGGPHVRVMDVASQRETQGFFAYDAAFSGGIRVATGYYNDDNVLDIVTSPGAGGGPHIRVFDGYSGKALAGPLGNFFAYSPLFTGGVFVAAADFDADGQTDVVTAAGAGGGPHVRVFRASDGSLMHDLFAFASGFTGGVRVAVGDVNGDGTPDIVTAAGPGGGPHVRVFNGKTGGQLAGAVGSFYAYDPRFNGGVFVSVGDVDGDGHADIITGPERGGGPHVRVFSGINGSVISEFFAYDASFSGGVRVGAINVDSDRFAELVVGAGPGGGPHVRVLRVPSLVEVTSFYAYDARFAGGVFIGSAPPRSFSLSSTSQALVAEETNLVHERFVSTTEKGTKNGWSSGDTAWLSAACELIDTETNEGIDTLLEQGIGENLFEPGVVDEVYADIGNS